MHIYPEGVRDNRDCVKIGVENTGSLTIRDRMCIDSRPPYKFVLKVALQVFGTDKDSYSVLNYYDLIFINKDFAHEQ